MQQLKYLALIGLASCISLKPVDVFDGPSLQDQPAGFDGFYSTNIFSDYITDEVWFTQAASCLTIETSKELSRSGEASLHLKWDKVSQSCEWLGLGFGWDAWNAKDLKPIMNNGAIEMWVRNKEGSRSGLPLAACLEDYSGGQAWLGFSENTIVGKEIGKEWTKVRLPLCEFEWDAANGANPSNIKQLIIQFEADGDVYIDDIQVVEFNGSFRKRANLKLNNTSLNTEKIDGNISAAWGAFGVDAKGNKTYLSIDEEFLYVASKIADDTPFQNPNDGKDIWNGDALEIAFSNVPAGGGRSSYLKTIHQHFAIRLNEEPMVWNWRKQERINEAEVAVVKKGTVVTVEAKIPLKYFGALSFRPQELYALEVAHDFGAGEGRTKQLRWNSSGSEGFHKNPKLWGEMIFN